MQIAKHKVVTLDYTLKDDDGNIIDSSGGRGDFTYLHGTNNIIPGLEKGLVGKQVGDDLSVRVAPAEGYGERDDSLTQVVPRAMFETDHEIDVGMQFHAQSTDGHMLNVTVVDITEDEVTVDGNHPLAGVNLNFQVKVISVRDATAEELAHGHVHGPGGHHH